MRWKISWWIAHRWTDFCTTSIDTYTNANANANANAVKAGLCLVRGSGDSRGTTNSGQPGARMGIPRLDGSQCPRWR